MGMIFPVGVGHVFKTHWGNWSSPSTIEYNKHLQPNTYMLIFSVGYETQKKMFDDLVKSGELTLHYQSPTAVNKTPGHGCAPRNTLVIFTKS